MAINRKSSGGGGDVANPMTASLDGGGNDITNVNDISAGGLTLADLTASQIVESSAGKVLTSAAKGTAYNKAFGTSAGTVAQGNDARIVAAKGDGDTILWADGSAGTPGAGFNDDSDNGFYRKAANDWFVIVGGQNVINFKQAENKVEAIFLGKIRYNTTDVNAATYAVLETDYYLQVRRTATGACTITLPLIATVADGTVYIIKDSGYNASTNAITVARTSTNKIDNVAGSYTAIESGESRSFMANSTSNDWEIF